MNAENTAIATVPARAALAGNPSDGYGGSVLAVPVVDLSATVRVAIAEAPSIEEFEGRRTESDHGVFGLIEATVRRFRARPEITLGPVSVQWSTTIPRSVGLGGSSALVLAVVEALADLTDAAVPDLERAALALAVEVDDLGIVAGPQDRVVQALGVPVLMHFDEPGPLGLGRHEPVGGDPLDELYVAWSEAGATSSGEVHGALRDRWSAAGPDNELRKGMAEIAATARTAAIALRAADRCGLDDAIDESLRLRVELVGVDDTTSRLATAARSAGASANSAGSGGAIVGRCPPERFPELAASIEAGGGRAVRVGGLSGPT